MRTGRQALSRDDALKMFFSALNEEEKDFLGVMSTFDGDLLVRTAVNELDWLDYRYQRKPLNYDEQEQLYLLRMGVARLIKLSLDAREMPQYGFLARRDEGRARAALEVAAGAGMIQHGRRVAQSVASGLCEIEVDGSGEFLVTLPPILHDDEYYERAVAAHYRVASRTAFQQVLQTPTARKLARRVDKTLAKLVFPFAKHFIGYDARPLLDAYFFSLAFSELQLFDGYDSFRPSVHFGGIPFRTYLLGLNFVIAVMIRHERFAQSLVRKDRSIRLENILTITAEARGFVESLRDAINLFGSQLEEEFQPISIEEANVVFSVLAVNKKSSVLLDAPGSPMPLLVQYSDEGVLECMSARHDQPVLYLLNSLKHHFPAEYSREQQTREKAMQDGIRRVVDGVSPDIIYMENVLLKLDGRTLTDIDLVVIDPQSGIVIFTQIKHQDPYAGDLHAKRVRSERLAHETNRWLAAVRRWTECVGEEGIRASLRLGRSFPKPRLLKLVIARYFAHPLAPLTKADDELACATWIQLFNASLLLKEHKTPSTIGGLFSLLKRIGSSEEPQQHQPEPSSKWTIRNLTFRVRQLPGESTWLTEAGGH